MGIVARGLIAAAGGLCLSTAATAALTPYTGVDTGLPPAIDLINTQGASNAFVTALGTSALVDFFGTQDFEKVTAPANGADLNLTFGDVTATLKSSTGSLKTGPDGIDSERRSVPGGSNFWQVNSGATFEIKFNRLVSGFSFWGTDIGEAGGSLTMELLDASGNTVGNRIAVATGGASPGTALFWGIIAGNSKDLFQTVRFITSQPTTGGDTFGFDTFTVAAQDLVVNPTPEPASLALVGLALAGVAASRRRRA